MISYGGICSKAKNQKNCPAMYRIDDGIRTRIPRRQETPSSRPSFPRPPPLMPHARMSVTRQKTDMAFADSGCPPRRDSHRLFPEQAFEKTNRTAKSRKVDGIRATFTDLPVTYKNLSMSLKPEPDSSTGTVTEAATRGNTDETPHAVHDLRPLPDVVHTVVR
jgi:hypothetical protein